MPPLPTWQVELQTAIRSQSDLIRRAGLAADDRSAAVGAPPFRVLVPESFAAKIQPGDLSDPLLRQVLASHDEDDAVEGFSTDPVGDGEAALAPGLLQKYAGRALLITTGHCAIHCRYCFRRSYPYQEGPHSDADWQPALAALQRDASLSEVILSGGDPLTLSDERLSRLVERLAAIPHLRRLRIHTRLPVVIPSRVTPSLLDWLTATRLIPIVVIHSNHAQELDDDVEAAVGKLRRAQVQLLNQAVLLAGVNDSVEAQAALCERLVELGVAPYYLHQLDRVAGAAHFETSVEDGRRIMAELHRRLPGYAIPRYVCETPGSASKRQLYP